MPIKFAARACFQDVSEPTRKGHLLKTIDDVPIEELLLDPENPRLPEDVQQQSQADILAYLDEHDVLDELIESFVANGYFRNEPILVLPPDQDGKRVVVEGNRRTSAAMRLVGSEAAKAADLVADAAVLGVTREQLDELSRLPAFELEDRDEVSRYLGFRHISGLKTWGAEAKARYLWLQIERAAANGSSAPFFDVGRQVGSNAAGVRTAYNSFNLLQAASRLGLSADLDYIKRDRFTVWTRLLGTANVPAYIGVDVARGSDYTAVRDRANDLMPERVEEVLNDLVPQPGAKRAVLQDSRSATNYSEVIGNERARAVLREYDNLALALQVVEQGQLRERLIEITESVEVLAREVPRMDQPGDQELSAAKELSAHVRALLGVVRSQMGDEDE